jgi:hypothetical protein
MPPCETHHFPTHRPLPADSSPPPAPPVPSNATGPTLRITAWPPRGSPSAQLVRKALRTRPRGGEDRARGPGRAHRINTTAYAASAARACDAVPRTAPRETRHARWVGVWVWVWVWVIGERGFHEAFFSWATEAGCKSGRERIMGVIRLCVSHPQGREGRDQSSWYRRYHTVGDHATSVRGWIFLHCSLCLCLR